MSHFDVFNGDADGIFALIQLRKAEPKASTLISGVKRDIALVAQVKAKPGDCVTVLDVSLDKNREAVEALLSAGIAVTYFDHHYVGTQPTSTGFEGHIDTGSQWCTSLLVDRHLGGAQHLWAIAGTYGDNLIAIANDLAAAAGLTISQREQLQALGELVNYNGYGRSVADLHFAPAELYQRLQTYASPFAVWDDTGSPVHQLERGFAGDLAHGEAINASTAGAGALVYRLPNAPWAFRISGTLANLRARQNPDCAIALLTESEEGSWTVSVRAPVNAPQGADQLCREFETGGGRTRAAGINRLPHAQLDNFILRLATHYPGSS
ncbi:DHH family phosphoesterase [Ferrimonas pelagia]|uniref:DHH family phosphoesterase n=1 Tax=Ferrimonas pelagia TaxID=1177826 RepID=A0ABP9ED87_9GAMM